MEKEEWKEREFFEQQKIMREKEKELKKQVLETLGLFGELENRIIKPIKRRLIFYYFVFSFCIFVMCCEIYTYNVVEKSAVPVLIFILYIYPACTSLKNIKFLRSKLKEIKDLYPAMENIRNEFKKF